MRSEDGGTESPPLDGTQPREILEGLGACDQPVERDLEEVRGTVFLGSQKEGSLLAWMGTR
jgi:hypothetical protein